MNPRPRRPIRLPRLGDAVGRALSSVGLTPERVGGWLGGECGCSARKERLNRLSDWAGGVLGMGPDEAKEKLKREA